MEQSDSHDSGANQYMSRRERRELTRAQKGGLPGASRSMLRRVLIWGGALLVIALLGWGMVQLSKNTVVPVGDGVLAVPVSDQDNTKGPASAKVTLVEYSDFQCPACAAFSSVVSQALDDPALKDNVRFVYRYMPLTSIHPNAMLSSQAAQAAALQGKFWEMHDVLFQTQDSWASLSTVAARKAFIEYAVRLGLDESRFTSDIDSGAVKARVKADLDSGTASGVSGTPTFFVNGARMTHPQSYDEFKQNLLTPLNEHQ